MDIELQVSRCLEDLGARNGIASLRLETDGSTGIHLKNGSDIYFRFLRPQNRLYIYTTVAPLPPTPDAAWSAQALALNCFAWRQSRPHTRKPLETCPGDLAAEGP